LLRAPHRRATSVYEFEAVKSQSRLFSGDNYKKNSKEEEDLRGKMGLTWDATYVKTFPGILMAGQAVS